MILDLSVKIQLFNSLYQGIKGGRSMDCKKEFEIKFLVW